MALTKQQLHDELVNDPASMGYAAHVAANDDAALSAILCDRAAGVAKGYSLTKATIKASELLACMTVADYVTRSADQKAAWQNMLIASSSDGVPVANANIQAQASAIWNSPSATTTWTNLAAAIVRGCSRAEQLGGEGYAPSAAEVSIALRN